MPFLDGAGKDSKHTWRNSWQSGRKFEVCPAISGTQKKKRRLTGGGRSRARTFLLPAKFVHFSLVEAALD